MTPTDHHPPSKAPAGPGGHHHDDHLYDQSELHNEDVAHEHSDVNVRAVIAFAVGLAIVVSVCALVVLGLFNVLEHQAAANDPVMSPLAQPASQLPPEPRLLTNERQVLHRFRAEQAQGLTGIDDAKKRLLEQGLPVRADAPADPWLGTHSPSRGESSGGRAIPIRPGVVGSPQPVPPAATGSATGPPAAPPKSGGH
jgi:hypothetical protein